MWDTHLKCSRSALLLTGLRNLENLFIIHVMYTLLCSPIINIPQNVITVEKCRIVNVVPTDDKNTYVMTILDAPEINVLPDRFIMTDYDDLKK